MARIRFNAYSLLALTGLFGATVIGGGVLFILGAPMPFLIGGIIGAALFVWSYETPNRLVPKMSPYIRLCAIAMTGAMIGSRVPPTLFDTLSELWISALMVLPFVLFAHMGNYTILRRIGGYRAVDAYFAGMPGGLIEAVLLGEKAGADMRILTVQHFVRVLSIVMFVPFMFFIITGEVVGSASGSSMAEGVYDLLDIGMIAAIAATGLVAGRALKLPAAHLLGPLMVAIFAVVTFSIDINVPQWLLNFAQFMIGATLGAQFSGISKDLLKRSLKLGAISVVFMLALGSAFAFSLAPFVPMDIKELLISFAAGGLAEMSLIALSLNLSPVIVALHHLLRIFLSIWLGNILYNRFFKAKLKV